MASAQLSDPPASPAANDTQLADSLSAKPLKATPKAAFKQADSMGFVMDVPVELRVELGRQRSRIGDLLRLGPGSVLELDKPNGEPLDIYVNDRLIARGEAVVVGERYGIRLTEVLIHDALGDGDE